MDSIGLTSFEAWYGAKIQVISDEIPLAPGAMLFYIGEILGFVGKILDVKDSSHYGEPLTTIWVYLRHNMVGKSKLFWTKCQVKIKMVHKGK